MTQREVTDKENIKWVCVQAYAGLEGKNQDKAAELSQTNDGKVPVVCTPTGGAKSVRITVDKNWEELPDEDLLKLIASAS